MTADLPRPAEWLVLSEAEVFGRFAALPGAVSDGEGPGRFVFVPGTRSDRVLLVAHADTHWGDAGITPACLHSDELGPILHSTQAGRPDGIGIGADDRAGCAALWELRGLGHSLLITGGEEDGCVAARRLAGSDRWSREIGGTHGFAVELDREGRDDAVFYDIATEAFARYVQDRTGYVARLGTSTDIRHICRTFCGVNLSVGYRRQHHADELLSVRHWEATVAVVGRWLSAEGLPGFPLEGVRFTWEGRPDPFRRLAVGARHYGAATDRQGTEIELVEDDGEAG